MISTVFMCLVIITKIQDNEAIFRHRNELHQARVDNLKNKINREQLSRIVDYLNKDNQKKEQNDDNRLDDADKESYNVKDVMKLVQKNYNAKTAYYDGHKDDIAASDVRVHVIKNPEILKEYIKSLRKRYKSTSSSSSDVDTDILNRRLDDKDDLRRNAQFRVDKGKSNEKEDERNIKSLTSASAELSVELAKHLQQSVEATPFKVNEHQKGRKRSEVKKRNRNNSDKERAYYARSQSKKYRASGNPTEPWNMITVTLNPSYEIEESDNTGAAKKGKKHWGEYNNKEDNAWEKSDYKGKQKRGEGRKRDTDRKKKSSWENKDDDWNAKEKDVVKNDLDDNWKPKKKTGGNDWDVTKDEAKKAEADSWHNVGLDDPLKSTRKSWQRSENKWKAQQSYEKLYVARNNYKVSSGFQGRTPIPFVGRQGIYDDK